MSLSETQQANGLIDRSPNILLAVPEKASLDSTSSMIALYLSLVSTRQYDASDSKTAIDQVNPSHVPFSLQFLSGSSQVKTSITKQTEVVLDIAGPTSITEIRQQPLQQGVRLHLSLPKNFTVTKDQIESSVRSMPYDTAIIFGAADLEELGPLFTENADFFYNTPIINIDHRASNEHYGTINMVDITAGSNAEVTHDLIASRGKEAINPDIATALYAGVIAGTESFQKPSTTPRSFQVAASLIEKEANNELVIQHLVKTKPLKIIKLAGSLYAQLRQQESVGLYWATLSAKDFRAAAANTDDVPAVMKELGNNIAGYNISFLLYQAPDSHKTSFTVYLMLGKGLSQRRLEIQQILGATKNNGAFNFNIEADNIAAAEQVAHDKIRRILP